MFGSIFFYSMDWFSWGHLHRTPMVFYQKKGGGFLRSCRCSHYHPSSNSVIYRKPVIFHGWEHLRERIYGAFCVVMGHGGTPSSHPELRMTMKTLGDLTVKPWCDLGCPILGKPHLWKAMWKLIYHLVAHPT